MALQQRVVSHELSHPATALPDSKSICQLFYDSVLLWNHSQYFPINWAETSNGDTPNWCRIEMNQR